MPAAAEFPSAPGAALASFPHPMLSMEMLCSDLGWEHGVLALQSVIQLCKCSLGLPAPNPGRQGQLGHPLLLIIIISTDGIACGELCDFCGWKNLSCPQNSFLQDVDGCSWGSEVDPGFVCLMPCLCSPSQNFPRKSKVKAPQVIWSFLLCSLWSKQSSVGHRVKDAVCSQLPSLLKASLPPGALFVPVQRS